MKRTALVLTCILLLFSVTTEMELINLAEVNAQENQQQIMSFEEAIEAANASNKHQTLIMFLITETPQSVLLTDESGVSGYLMWLASNGTFYEAEYPDGRVLGEIGYTIDQDNWIWNSTDPCYIWQLNYPYGEEYTLFANNGTIIFHTGPKYGPVPTPATFPQEIAYGTAVAVLVAIVSIGLLVYFNKCKH
ncbi:hypothetical protein E2P63_04550 [Candidatus Bathyarchaeota archaeon]|nr:hypothetical protein E2P63_04550 [Candidatus Bathyarchaeota archaeon]